MRAEQLTVVIPTSGRWAILERTLAALAAQTAAGFTTTVVVNGLDKPVPWQLQRWPRVRFLAKVDEGPGPARNLAARLAETPLLLFLGDDTIPREDLVARHLARHGAEPQDELAVLGHVRWHPDVARGRVNRWLEWSGAQFDYRQLDREPPERHRDVGFGRFYTSNVSLKRALFDAAGGFDEDFRFGYEDIDFGYRAAQRGMRLCYERAAVALHLHRHDLPAVRARFELVGAAELLMAWKHEWFRPWYREPMLGHAAAPAVSPFWPLVVDRIPPRAGRLRAAAEARADRWYHQQLAPAFLSGWARGLDLVELREYLGDAYEPERLHRHMLELEAEAADIGDERSFYRTSEIYLYDLTAFAMSGTKDPYRQAIRRLVPSGARLLDYGCGIGADGLRLLESGYRVEFADFANPSVEFLRWRLARRGLEAPVHDLDRDVPAGFDLAYAFDVIEHVEDPWAFLAELEARAELVVVNLLAPLPGDTALHRKLPIRAILRHAERRGLRHYRRHHGRSHLIAYRGGASRRRLGRAERVRSALERRTGARHRG